MSWQRSSAPRYRRRILLVGSLAALALFSIGFPIVNNRIESDLERRVPAELAAAGFTGISASFSGQDGRLRCEQPLDDPEAATRAAYDVWGVREITLDRLCRVNRAPTVSNGDDEPATSESDSALVDLGSTTSAATIADGSQSFDTVADAVAGDPRLSFLAVLLDEAGSTEALADPAAAPMTLFAATDDAFDALPVDVTAQLRSDPDLLLELLAHHIAAGTLLAADLAAGPLPTMDGRTVMVAIAESGVTVDGASVVAADVLVGNGVVHVIDRVLVPAEFGFTSDEPAASVAAVLADGALTLDGVVASEVERMTLLDVATAAVGAGGVIDELTVDPDAGLSAEITGNLSTLIAPMPTNLVSGVAGFDGSSLYLNGVAVSDEAAAALTAVAATLGVEADLELRPDAGDAEAAELEQELNASVAAEPVQFEPSSAVLTADTAAVLDDLAARGSRFAGVSITVIGHTDSDGDAAANLTLSRARAEAVRSGLIDRGIDAGSIVAEGVGAQQPILVGGIEDKEASRRVEFRIEATN